MSDLILTSSLKKDYNLYRIGDDKTTFGFVLAHENLAIEEVLKEYDSLNGAILGSAFNSKKIESVTPDQEPDQDPEEVPEEEPEEESEEEPEPSPEQELNDNDDPQDPADTGSDPGTGEGSTPEDPVVNPDPDPHIF